MAASVAMIIMTIISSRRVKPLSRFEVRGSRFEGWGSRSEGWAELRARGRPGKDGPPGFCEVHHVLYLVPSRAVP